MAGCASIPLAIAYLISVPFPEFGEGGRARGHPERTPVREGPLTVREAQGMPLSSDSGLPLTLTPDHLPLYRAHPNP